MVRKLSLVAALMMALLFAVFVSTKASASAKVKFCNETSETLDLAIGFSRLTIGQTEYKFWSKGWIRVAPKQCHEPTLENPDEGFVYYFAVGPGIFISDEKFENSFCVSSDRKFLLPALDNCYETPGQSKEYFLEKRLGQFWDPTTYLVAPQSPRASPDASSSYSEHRACIGDAAGSMQCGRLTEYDRRYLCRTPYDQIAREFLCTKSDGSLQRYKTEAYRGGKDGGECGYAWVRFRCFDD